MTLNRLSRLLETPNQNNGGAEGNGGAASNSNPAATTPPVTPFVVREKSTGKIGVEPGPSKLPEGAKDFEFKADSSLVDAEPGDVKAEAVKVEQKAQTPLEAAKAMIAEGKKEGEQQAAQQIPPKKEEGQQQQATPVQPRQIQPKAKGQAQPVKEFDYTGFTQEEAAELRQMSTTARDFTVKLIKQNKELSTQQGGQYLQHPDAYVLDPAFNQIGEDVSYAEKEAKYWEQQLILIRQGKPWKKKKKWDANGNPIVGAEQVANEQADIAVSRWANNAYQIAQQKRGELQNFAATHKQRVQADANAIQQERARRFGWVADPKIMQSTFINDAGQEVTVEACRNALINLFPPYMRKELGVQVAADLFAAFQIQAEELRNGGASKQVQQEIQREERRAEPVSGAKSQVQPEGQNGGVKSPFGRVKEFSIAGMPV